MDPYIKALMDFLKNSKPEEWHNVALSWNWDNDIEPIKWIIENPKCDKGTALLIYWSAGPKWISQYSKREEVEDWQKEVYDLIANIQVKYLSDFYQDEKIAFNPKDDRGIDWTKDYSEIVSKVAIPDIFYQPSKGHPIKRKHYPDGIPDEVANKIINN